VGSHITFVLRESVRAREDLKEMLDETSAKLEGGRPTVALYVNCAARGRGLHGHEGIDTSYIRRTFKDTRVIGWFSSFVIGPLNEGSAMYSYTGVFSPLEEATDP
jgi:small ligand-binding sensory domain FIST